MATTKQLLALQAVERHGSFTGAAIELGIHVASAFKRVKKLEAEMGKDLTEGSRGVGTKLTQAGTGLLKRSKKLLRDL
jgi:molybdate transport repressor ModE-like protein